MNYTTTEIATIVKAQKRDYRDHIITALLTDSRSLTFPEETLFFALVTERNDGHRYIKDLYRKGVRDFVVEHSIPGEEEMDDANFIVVKDTLDALQQLAAAHRRRFQIPVIGVTGSNGKTTVKEWLYQLLQPDYNTVRSPRSYNSQIGVPLSVWQIGPKTEMAIFEAGISQPDEMVHLEEIIKPTLGLITNIGEAHQEGFQTIQQKCLEKLILLKACDCIIYDGDNELIGECVEKLCFGCREIAWSRKDRDKPLYISKITKGSDSTRIEYTYLQYHCSFTIPFVEDASIENAIHCLAVMLYFNRPPEVIAERMARLTPVAMRMEVKEGINNCLIINDSYNSDINSLTIALDFQNRRAAAKGFINATDCADYLTKKGMPFRDAYKLTGCMVSDCIAKDKTLEELTLDEFKGYSALFENDIYDAIDLVNCCEGRTSYGGPSAASVEKQIALATARLDAWEEENA